MSRGQAVMLDSLILIMTILILVSAFGFMFGSKQIDAQKARFESAYNQRAMNAILKHNIKFGTGENQRIGDLLPVYFCNPTQGLKTSLKFNIAQSVDSIKMEKGGWNYLFYLNHNGDLICSTSDPTYCSSALCTDYIIHTNYNFHIPCTGKNATAFFLTWDNLNPPLTTC